MALFAAVASTCCEFVLQELTRGDSVTVACGPASGTTAQVLAPCACAM